MALINERTLLLSLQSLTRAWIAREDPSKAIPLGGMEPSEFSGTTWEALGVSAAGRDILFARLQGMFPPPAANAGPSHFATPGNMARQAYGDWENGTRNIVYKSSGSSGEPKELVHTYEEICQETACLARLLPHIEHVAALTPQHHCYGFTFGVLLHQYIGASYAVYPPYPTIFGNIPLGRVLVVGYPDFWSRVGLAGLALKSGFICLSAGSPWPDEQIRQIMRPGCADIMEIYGSSENGAIGYRTGPHDFTLLDYWMREQRAGLSDVLARVSPAGVRKRCLPQDELSWTTERAFRPLRRIDSAVHVSGTNVYPLYIAGLIEEHPLVAACRVRLMRPDEGGRLKAFVVPAEGADIRNLRGELKRFCRNRLSAPERPIKFTFGSAILKNNFGKEIDWT
ncbi:MAG: AMP-binding protein [Deltaproteobacteria bacterium]|jgi:4-coumarate--CoA ligase|nr:AMP-binding protein [Deltaproteobacteria bacterium]